MERRDLKRRKNMRKATERREIFMRNVNRRDMETGWGLGRREKTKIERRLLNVKKET